MNAAEDHAQYMAALEAQWAALPEIPRGELLSIFFGGGTPSLVEPEQIQSLIQRVRERATRISPELEVTMEANPGTISVARLQRYRMAGVNRLSLGVQAWQDEHLHRLNRIHSVQDSEDAVSAARAAGFDNLSLDLIYGLPQQTLGEWRETVAAVLDLQPEHLSLYQLQVEEGTPLATSLKRGLISLPVPDLTADMADYSTERLRQSGYIQYEISNFCRPGRHSRHNRLYWTMNPYLALGAGAHGYWDSRRWWNIRGVRRYMEAVLAGESAVAGEESLSRAEEMREYIWLGLRENDGLSRSRFVQRFSVVPEAAFGARLGHFQRKGLIESSPEIIRLTDRGRDIANYVFREFVGDGAGA
jgi:oxygen-independent coproporphyrinogen-3 oxidase